MQKSDSTARPRQWIQITAILVIAAVVVGIGLLLTLGEGNEPESPDQSIGDVRTLEAGRARGSTDDLDLAARHQVDPVLGPADAPVTIIEYGAYGCPSCRQFHQLGIIDRLLADFDEQVKFVFRDFPVITPAYDRRAAEVAQCALDQSNDAFWAFHDTLYTHVEVGASTDELVGWALALGLDEEALRACVDSGIHESTVAYDLERGLALGLPGTPSFLINEQRVFAASESSLRAAIQQALDAS
jgi:protein-disulfide isomerase